MFYNSILLAFHRVGRNKLADEKYIIPSNSVNYTSYDPTRLQLNNKDLEAIFYCAFLKLQYV